METVGSDARTGWPRCHSCPHQPRMRETARAPPLLRWCHGSGSLGGGPRAGLGPGAAAPRRRRASAGLPDRGVRRPRQRGAGRRGPRPGARRPGAHRGRRGRGDPGGDAPQPCGASSPTSCRGCRCGCRVADATAETTTDAEGYFLVRLRPRELPPVDRGHRRAGRRLPRDHGRPHHAVRGAGPRRRGPDRDHLRRRRHRAGDRRAAGPADDPADVHRVGADPDDVPRHPGALPRPRPRRANPVFYVSSSPWNLYAFVTAFLRHRDFPPARCCCATCSARSRRPREEGRPAPRDPRPAPGPAVRARRRLRGARPPGVRRPRPRLPRPDPRGLHPRGTARPRGRSGRAGVRRLGRRTSRSCSLRTRTPCGPTPLRWGWWAAEGLVGCGRGSGEPGTVFGRWTVPRSPLVGCGRGSGEPGTVFGRWTVPRSPLPRAASAVRRRTSG